MTAQPAEAQAAWPRPGVILASAIIAVPLLCFAINVLSWITYGVDIPFMDDWRAYQSGQAGSFAIGYLFTPANDTLYPVGLFLDSLAQHLLRGNSVAYQLISLTSVLGLLLLLQWRLLRSVLQDRLLAACAFSATLFMLQPDSYWGLQDMAYHQAVPLVSVLFALHIVLCNRWHAWLSPLLLVVSGFVAGLIYISGAFAMLALGGSLVVAAILLQGPNSPHIARGGLWLTLVGIATSIPQLWVIVVVQKGTHRADAPMAYPTDADFWFYLLGKVGRSLMLPMDRPILSLGVVVVACVALAAAIAWSFHAARRTARDIPMPLATTTVTTSVTQAFVILFALSAVVGVYLAMVAAGRANLRPESMGLREVFSFAFLRFHFFWATLLWPWLFAIVLLAVQRGRSTLVKPLGVVASLVLVLSSFAAGAFSHRAFYVATADLRVTGIKCIRERVEASKPILCDSLLPADLSASLRYAEKIDASFSRTLEFTAIKVLPINPARQVPLVLGTGDVVSGTFASPKGGTLSAVGLLVGNYGGRADGTFSLEVCSPRTCSRASMQVSESADNDFLVVDLAAPLNVESNEPLTFSLSVSGSTHPLAAWLYDSVDGSAVITSVRRGATQTMLPGQTVKMSLQY